MTRIFITGASGYIGGEVLYRLKNSDLAGATFALLNRNPQKGEQILKVYPDVDVISGDLDSIDLITKEAEKADVVLHLASTKHLASAKAIVAGLGSSSRKEAGKRGTWIQMSGATLYAGKEIASGKLGNSSSEVHADKSDIADILSIIHNSPSRAVEQLAIEQNPSDIWTALLPGPLIYGVGRGPVHKISIQAPAIAAATVKLGHGIRLLKGENAWSNVHITDLGELFYLLTKAALEGRDVGWNREGVYHPENGKLEFGKLDALVAEEAVKQGLIKSAELQEIDAAKADELGASMSIFWGTNAVITGQRAKESLGWKPVGRSLEEDVPDLVRRAGEETKP